MSTKTRGGWCDGLDNDCDETIDEFCPGTRLLSIDDDEIKSGETLVAPVRIDDADRVDSVHLVVVHDPAVLQIQDVLRTPLTSHMTISWSHDDFGLVTIDLYSGTPLSSGPGELVHLVYDVIGSTGEHSYLEIRECPQALNEGRISALCDSALIQVVDAYPACADDDGDLYAVCHERCDPGALKCGDCDDEQAGINPEAPEVCNDVDEDCDGSVDEELATSTYHRDADGDGFGDLESTTDSCYASPPSGYVDDATDCDDARDDTYPGAPELCADVVDNDCDGTIDEGCPDRRTLSIANDHGGRPGESVIVPVVLDDGTDVISIDLTLSHDPEVLDFVDAERTPYTGLGGDEWQLQYQESDPPGTVWISIYGSAALDPSGGDVVNVEYTVIGEPLATTAITMSECDTVLNEGNIAAECIAGAFEVHCTDEDGDGFSDCDTYPECILNGLECGDCDDGSASTHSGAAEICDAIDNDCDELVDEDESGEDADRDGLAAACDNCPSDWNPHQFDHDEDGQGEDCDIDDGIVLITSIVGDIVSWQDESQALVSYDLYRGSVLVMLEEMPGGSITQDPNVVRLADRFCGLASPSYEDSGASALLGPGEAVYWVVGGEEMSGGDASLGEGAGHQGAALPEPRRNDHPCP